jgi:hypothetical protein
MDEEKEGLLLDMYGGVLVVKACDQQTKPTVKIVHTKMCLAGWHFRVIILMLVDCGCRSIDFVFFFLAERRIE